MYGKLLIRCELEVVTGLHIGDSSAFSAIGAVPAASAGLAKETHISSISAAAVSDISIFFIAYSSFTV